MAGSVRKCSVRFISFPITGKNLTYFIYQGSIVTLADSKIDRAKFLLL
jgi:hypothetical protein